MFQEPNVKVWLFLLTLTYCEILLQVTYPPPKIILDLKCRENLHTLIYKVKVSFYNFFGMFSKVDFSDNIWHFGSKKDLPTKFSDQFFDKQETTDSKFPAGAFMFEGMHAIRKRNLTSLS